MKERLLADIEKMLEVPAYRKIFSGVVDILTGGPSWTLSALIATVAHRRQRDKGGNTYARHPFRVAEYMQTEHEQSVALLHDVVEDTDVTLEDLRFLGYPQTDVMIVSALSKPRDKSQYDEERYFNEIEKSPCAARIKYLDMKDNSRLDRLKNPTLEPKDVERMNSYIRGMKRLRAFAVGLMLP